MVGAGWLALISVVAGCLGAVDVCWGEQARGPGDSAPAAARGESVWTRETLTDNWLGLGRKLQQRRLVQRDYCTAQRIGKRHLGNIWLE